MPSDNDIQTYRDTLQIVDDLYNQYSQFGHVILGGDFNASCRSEDQGKTNVYKSRSLCNFLNYNNIFAVNTSGMRIGSEYSYITTKSMLDYIFVDNIIYSRVNACNIFTEGSISSTSDHLPIFLTIMSNIPVNNLLYSDKKWPAWYKTSTESLLQYMVCLNSELDKLSDRQLDSPVSVETFYSDLVTALIYSAQSNISSTKYNPYTKPYWTTEVKIAHKNEREMRRTVAFRW